MYDNNVRKRSWLKQGEASQMMAKSELTPRKGWGCVLERNRLLRAAARSNDWFYCQHLERLLQVIERKIRIDQ